MTRRERTWGRAAALLAGLMALLGCPNAGDQRVLGVDATGIVNGVVFFDANGSGQNDQGDVGFSGLTVRLIARGTVDTVASVTTNSSGVWRRADLPVGTYHVVVDTATAGDTVHVFPTDTLVTVPPYDSVLVSVGVAYPRVSIAALRSSALGRRVFITGAVLVGPTVFGDTTMNLADTSGFIRATRVRIGTIVTGDSVRLLGTRATRDGQPVFDDVSGQRVGAAFIPTAAVVTTGDAASAIGGSLDAALVRVLNVTIADTATVAGDYVLTVDDGSGSLSIVLDKEAALPLTPYVPGVAIDATGLLVPSGGVWQLKPRASSDLVLR